MIFAAEFYLGLGFVESFRTPDPGEPVHIEPKMDGFTLGIATIEAAKEHYNLAPKGERRSIEVVLWTDNADAAVDGLVRRGARLLSPAHDFLDGELRGAGLLIRTGTVSISFRSNLEAPMIMRPT